MVDGIEFRTFRILEKVSTCKVQGTGETSQNSREEQKSCSLGGHGNIMSSDRTLMGHVFDC